MTARRCDLDHDCALEVWHRHDFDDRSGSIRWSTDDLHVASRLVSDLLVDPVDDAAAFAAAAEGWLGRVDLLEKPLEDPDDVFSALNAREPDPELW